MEMRDRECEMRDRKCEMRDKKNVRCDIENARCEVVKKMSPQSHLCRTWRRQINHDRFDIRCLPTCLIFCVLRFTHAFFEYGIDCITWYACSVYSDLKICVDAVLPNAATYHFCVQLLSEKVSLRT